MSLYYLLLLMARFHLDPRVGAVLFNMGFLILTPVKLVGLAVVFASLIAQPPQHAAPRLRSLLVPLWSAFAILPIIEAFAFQLPTPSESISSLMSFSLLLIATRRMVTTEERLTKTVRIMILASSFATLWTYKGAFVQHLDRPPGLEQDPNYEALTLITGIPLSIWMVRHESNRLWRWTGAGCTLAMAGAVLLAQSRAAIIASIVMGVMAVLHSRRKLITFSVLVLAVLMVIQFAPESFTRRFQSIKFTGTPANGDEESTRVHYELVKAGLAMIEAHPALGVGPERFRDLAQNYNPSLSVVADRLFIAHNTYIQIAAETGLPTLLLFVAMIGVAMMNCRAVRRGTSARLGDLGFALQLGLLAFSVAALSVTAEFIITFWLLTFLSQNLREIAAAVAVEPNPAHDRPQTKLARRPALVPLLTLTSPGSCTPAGPGALSSTSSSSRQSNSNVVPFYR